MISFELAEQLKKAGFPSGNELENPIEEFREWIEPTLSELIEACGKEFNQLQKGGRGMWKWAAFTDNNCKKYPDKDYLCYLAGDGDTPEIAVANLWLKLNKKT